MEAEGLVSAVADPGEHVFAALRNLPSARASLTTVRDGQLVTVPLSDLLYPVIAMRWLLRAKGLRSGDRVGVLGENSYDWIVLDLACLAEGLVVVGFDPVHPEITLELATQLRLAVLFTDQEELLDAAPFVLRLRVPSSHELSGVDPLPKWEPHRYEKDDVVAIKFTSGSVNLPKAIAATRKSIDSSIGEVQRLFRHDSRDNVLVFLPLHILQQRYWLYSALAFGFNLTVVAPHQALGAIGSERPTVIMGVPEFFEQVAVRLRADIAATQMQRVDLDAYRALRKLPLVSRLVGPYGAAQRHLGGRVRYLWTGSAPMRRETIDLYESAGIPLYQGYGTNETCIVAKNYPGNNRIGSVGKVLPNKAVVIEDDGHILVKSHHEVARCYLLASEEENSQTFLADGTVATGDLGYVDEDGYLFITGRRKELLVLPSGRKIHPSIIEDRIRAVAGVRNCMVTTAPGRSGVCAVIDAEDAATRASIIDGVSRETSDLPPDARVLGAVLVPEHFSRENGLLTSQYKLRRAAIAERYAREIAKMFEDSFAQ